MIVILQEDVKGLGRKGDVVKAKDGYARNFLLPKGLAILGDNKNIKNLNDKKESYDRKKGKEKEEAQKIADRLKDQKISLEVKAGENGKLFGSVTNKDIADEIKKALKITIDKRKINLQDTIKNTGEHDVDIKVYEGINAKIIVNVISK